MPDVEIPAPPVERYPLPDFQPKWLFIAGTWGDVIAGLGNAQHVLRELELEQGNVVLFTPDKTIAEWLRYQPMVGEVLDLRSAVPVKDIPTDPVLTSRWWDACCRAFDLDIPECEVWPCHVDFTLRERLPIHRPELRTLAELEWWAFDKIGDIARPRVLFQPRSETSCLWDGHWPHWVEAVQLVVKSCETAIILTGQGNWSNIFPNVAPLYDLVNQTPSMPHLFALADVCDAVVTTSNALSLYAAASDLPSIVCCNTTHRRPEQFFTRFARGPRSRIVEHYEGMAEFRAAWEEVLSC